MTITTTLLPVGKVPILAAAVLNPLDPVRPRPPPRDARNNKVQAGYAPRSGALMGLRKVMAYLVPSRLLSTRLASHTTSWGTARPARQSTTIRT